MDDKCFDVETRFHCHDGLEHGSSFFPFLRPAPNTNEMLSGVVKALS